ncbi:hypothetical protein L484_011858 [Morus notabilis]|uniref:Uncharacterized protein n=1 Tax=Morus notabilis TaxID=981085 RepID=W9S1W7_9ROSA|nr:hypothetical protein L484_011858 [Morus notabilis]
MRRLPPLSTEPNRCERAFVGNTIGQANGVYDKPLDLRFCNYTNEKSNLKGKSLAAALMSDAKFNGADMTEVVWTSRMRKYIKLILRKLISKELCSRTQYNHYSGSTFDDAVHYTKKEFFDDKKSSQKPTCRRK